MNKKLIKQLEGVGFERNTKEEVKDNLALEIGGYQAFCSVSALAFGIYYGGNFQSRVEGSWILNPTFPQILAAIKEHTGVDLTKKTKREEIEELKRKVESLEDAIKSQNEAIEELKNCINPTKHKYFFGVDHGNTSDCVDAISYATQAEEKKAFEVGDRVVIISNTPHYGHGASRRGVVYLVADVDLVSNEIGISIDHSLHLFLFNEVEHAPKESPKKTSITEVLENVLENVLYWDTSSEEYKDIIKKYLKENKESPKEKALEFGGFAETLVGKANIPKGSKVLITLRLDADNDFYCSTGQSDNHFEYYKPEELKAL